MLSDFKDKHFLHGVLVVLVDTETLCWVEVLYPWYQSIMWDQTPHAVGTNREVELKHRDISTEGSKFFGFCRFSWECNWSLISLKIWLKCPSYVSMSGTLSRPFQIWRASTWRFSAKASILQNHRHIQNSRLRLTSRNKILKVMHMSTISTLQHHTISLKNLSWARSVQIESCLCHWKESRNIKYLKVSQQKTFENSCNNILKML